MAESRRRFPWRLVRRILAAGAIGMLLLAGLTAAFLFCLPYLLSTDLSRLQIQSHAAGVLNRPVTIGAIRCRWSEGITLSAVRVPDDPAFSTEPLMAFDRLHLRLGLLRWRWNHPAIRLKLEGPRLNWVRHADGADNLTRFLAGIRPGTSAPAQPPVSETGGGPPRIPVDLTAEIGVTGIAVTARDEMTGHQMALQDGLFRLSLPDLRSAPVALHAGAALSLDGRPLPPLSFRTEIRHLIDADGKISPAGAILSVNGDLPGLRITTDHAAEKQETRLTLSCDLGTVSGIITPLLPAAVPTVSGRLHLAAALTGLPPAPLDFDLSFSGTALTASGERVPGGGAIGPVAFQFQQIGQVNLTAGTAVISEGNISLLKRGRLRWSGTAENLKGKHPSVDLAVEQIAVDLGELAALAAPLLPPDLTLSLPKEADALRITGGGIRVAGTLPAGSQEVTIGTLRITGTHLSLARPPLRMQVNHPDLSLDGCTVSLSDMQPRRIALRSTIRIEEMEISGPAAIHLSDLAVPDTRITIADLSRSRALPGTLSITSGLSLGAIQMTPTRAGGAEMSLTGLELPELNLAVAEGSRVKLSGAVHARECRMGGAAPLAVAGVHLTDLAATLDGLDLNSLITRTGTRHADTAVPENGKADLSGTVVIDGITSGGTAPLSVSDLRLTGLSLAADGVGFSGNPPRHVALQGSAAVGRLKAGGPQPMEIQGVTGAEIGLTADGLSLARGSILGITGDLKLDQRLQISTATLPQARIRNLVQSFASRITLTPKQVQLKEIRLTIPRVEVALPDLESEPLSLSLQSDALSVDPEALRADVSRAQFQVEIPKRFRLAADADVGGSGRERLRTRGQIWLSLTDPPAALRGRLPDSIELSGETAVTWDLDGRLPTEPEMQRLLQKPAWRLESDLPFLNRLSVGLEIPRAAGAFTPPDGSPLRIDKAATSAPLTYRLDTQEGGGVFSGNVTLEGIHGLPVGETPIGIQLALNARHSGFQSADFGMETRLAPLGLVQKLTVSLAGLDRVLRSPNPAAAWPLLTGEIQADFALARIPKAMPDLAVQGSLDAGMQLRLDGSRRLDGSVRMETPGLEIHLGDRIHVAGFRSRLRLSKGYHLALETDDTTGSRSKPALSATVLRPDTPPNRFDPSRGSDMITPHLAADPNLSFTSVDYQGPPFPLRADHGAVALLLDRGLPRLESIALDLLGGSIRGDLAIVPAPGGFALHTRMAFSEIDTGRLAPESTGSPTALESDRTITGQMTLEIPLATRVADLLAGLTADIRISRIGSRTIERLLYALDPYETNEAILSQRRLFRIGTPLWVRIAVDHGSLSLNGEVAVKSARIAIPPVSRVRLSGIGGTAALGRSLERLAPLIQAFSVLAARQLIVDWNGHITVGD